MAQEKATARVRFQMLFTESEREMFTAAAQEAGETLSAWLRRAGRERIARERKAAVK